MAACYVVLFNFKSSSRIPVDTIEEVFDPFKDWLRFHPESWLVYTDLTPKEIRNRLQAALKTEDPSIVVLETQMSGWAAYANEKVRSWIRRDHDDETGV
jgi:hypothetical protein